MVRSTLLPYPATLTLRRAGTDANEAQPDGREDATVRFPTQGSSSSVVPVPAERLQASLKMRWCGKNCRQGMFCQTVKFLWIGETHVKEELLYAGGRFRSLHAARMTAHTVRPLPRTSLRPLPSPLQPGRTRSLLRESNLRNPGTIAGDTKRINARRGNEEGKFQPVK